MEISVVIPAYNEAQSLKTLYAELTEVLSEIGKPFEIIFVNDGSTDESSRILDEFYASDKSHVKTIQFRNNFGKAAALTAGFKMAKGKIILQMDADLQDDPKEIPNFLKELNNGADMAVGWKQNRQDSLIKNQSSKVFNWVTNLFSRVKLHDHNCGFKAYKAELAKELVLYGEIYRFIGVLVSSDGYSVAEVKIQHRPRSHGKSKYNALRFIHGFLDLFTVIYISKFRSRPLHFFGYMGLVFFTFGFGIAVYLTGVKYLLGQAIGERPLLLFSVMLMIMGIQVTVTGLVGEQLNTMIYKDQKDYVIKKING